MERPGYTHTPFPTRSRRVPTAHVERPEPKPTTGQTALEYALFTFFGGALVVAAIAMFVVNSKSHRSVPNQIEAGIAADRVNVLVIATNRDTAEGLMLVSLKPSTRDVAVLSIPNELWVRLGKYGTRHIGSGFKVGNTSGYPGGGPGLLADTVSAVLGQPVHAFVRVQSAELERAVDSLGGVEVQVLRGAYDSRTRDRFTRGRHHLDGERAVRYALSKKMVGPANDRFEREARQREVLIGLLSRLPAVDTDALFIQDETATNLTRAQLAWMRTTLTGVTTRTVTLAPYVDVFDVKTLVDQGEALRPRAGTFQELRTSAANVFAGL